MPDLRRLFVTSVCLPILLLAAGRLGAQSLAILTPNRTPLDQSIESNLRAAFSAGFRVQRSDISEAAFASVNAATPFNMTTNDARDLGAVLGCDFFILIKSGIQRRAAIAEADYVESYAVFYVVSSRTGRLINWHLASQKGSDERDADHRLVASLEFGQLHEAIVKAAKTEPLEPPSPSFDEVPDPKTAAANGYRAPIPYRRIKPEYTRTAYLYDITATVELTVDLDDKGRIVHSEVTRWAGYGLDESVVQTVTSMNWRAAERNGKTLPARFLLRYNFRKIEKDDDDNE
jgi:hypothetical protein